MGHEWARVHAEQQDKIAGISYWTQMYSQNADWQPVKWQRRLRRWLIGGAFD